MKTGTIVLIVLLAFFGVTLLALALMMEYIFRTTFSRVQPKAVAYVEPPREKMNAIDQKRYDARKKLENRQHTVADDADIGYVDGSFFKIR